MVVRSYVPEAGDLVWLTFDPHARHEQRGRRPALILSPRAYNAKARLAIACPITTHAKGYPFEVAIPAGGKVAGVVLADHACAIPLVITRSGEVKLAECQSQGRSRILAALPQRGI